MQTQSSAKLKPWLAVLTALVYILIVWGAVVRASGSGLGCPDWPLCHGQIIPPFEKEVMIEYFHRLLASLVGIITLIVSLKVWKNPELRGVFGKKCAVILVLLLFQVLLGGVTVKSELHPYIVTFHLAVALIFLALVFNMTISILYDSTTVRQYDSGRLTIVPSYCRTVVLLVFIQILLGGMVATSHAGLVCPDFPTCNGLWIPPLEGLVAWQFFHRLTAFFIFGFVVILFFGKWRMRSVRWLVALVFLQMILGIANVLLELPFWIRVAHLATAVLIFLMALLSSYEFRKNTA
ncbi:MAG: COX15/CtaA family protein [Deltaproteobacteria bacterium]|nr:COX15/CtaA family protein [Deltaproteobacteria bacterium]